MKILAINPGSTSTKIAIYEYTQEKFKSIIRHNPKDLASQDTLADQCEFRKKLILDLLDKENIPFGFDAIIGRGGILKPISGGVYEINERIIHDCINSTKNHASNLGAIIAFQLVKQIPDCKAFIADPVVVDELSDIARISGSPLLPRKSVFHALNQRAIARRYASEKNKKYEEMNLIVCHMGGGISTGIHTQGRIVDVNNGLDGDGPFSPERAGSLPVGALVDLCFSGKYTKAQIEKMVVGQGGLMAHLGTNDMQEIEKRIEDRDQKARLISEAMAYNVSKSIGAASVVLKGNIDAILLTGGIAYSRFIVPLITEAVSFIAPVTVFPGEDEMKAMASNALSALKGHIPIQAYE